MEVASQGRVSQGQGTGEATVLDTSRFYQDAYNIQRDIAEREERKRQEVKQQNAVWSAQLADMPDVWQSDYEYVNKALNEYNDYIIDLKSKGVDPNNLDPTIMREMKRLENNVRRSASMAKDNEVYFNQAYNLFNQDKTNKYNKEFAADWFKDFADPSKTIEERSKLRTDSSPFKINYSMIELIDETIPKPEVKDVGRKKITSRNKDSHKMILLDYLTNDPVGVEKYESLKKPNETVVDFVERVAEEGQNRYPLQEDVQPAPQPRETKSDEDKGGYGTGNWNNKLSVSSQVLPNFKPGVTANTLYVTRTGTNDNVPPIQMADATGKTVNFQPISYHLRDDGAISVLGEVISGTGQDQTRTQTWMDYDTNKAAFQSQLMGMDLREEFNARNGGTTGTTKTGKTFTGVPTGGF
jgi:hypothetical protein